MLAYIVGLCYTHFRCERHIINIGESSSGRMAVSKTAHGGSNPSSPANVGIYQKWYVPFLLLKDFSVKTIAIKF